jgi:hypothetical protein
MSTFRTISRRSGTRAAVVAIVALSAGLLGACGSESPTEVVAPPASDGANLNPNEHRGHSGQPGTGSPKVNQREHFAQRDASGS